MRCWTALSLKRGLGVELESLFRHAHNRPWRRRRPGRKEALLLSGAGKRKCLKTVLQPQVVLVETGRRYRPIDPK